MGLILLEALGALVLLVGIVWWTMFSGRRRGELRPPPAPPAPPSPPAPPAAPAVPVPPPAPAPSGPATKPSANPDQP